MSVRLFARLRDLVGAGELDRQVPAGATVQRLWDGLASDFPGIRAYATSMSAAVNAEYSRMDTVLHDGDEVAFLPPVSGGSAHRSPAAGLRVPARRSDPA